MVVLALNWLWMRPGRPGATGLMVVKRLMGRQAALLMEPVGHLVGLQVAMWLLMVLVLHPMLRPAVMWQLVALVEHPLGLQAVMWLLLDVVGHLVVRQAAM